MESTYQDLPKSTDLEPIFSLGHTRKAKKDNTLSYQRSTYQLLPALGITSYAERQIKV
jgi:hypothetical protein